MGNKLKLSVTLDQEIVDEIDRVAQSGKRHNRSEVIERMLRVALKRRRMEELDRAIEAYYTALSAEEAAEDSAWAAAADETVRERW